MKYYAHSLKDKPQKEWPRAASLRGRQPLETHLKNAAELVKQFTDIVVSE